MSSIITNNDIITKLYETDKSSCSTWLESLHPSVTKSSHKAYTNIIDRCFKNYQALINTSKSRPGAQEKLDQFLSTNVQFPGISISSSSKKTTIGELSQCDCSYKGASYSLASEVAVLKSENVTLTRNKCL